MAKTTTAPCTQNVNTAYTQFAVADGACGAGLTLTPSNLKQLFVAGANDSILKSLIAATDDTANRILNLYRRPGNAGANYYFIVAIQVPLTAGNTGAIACLDLLGSAVFAGLCYDQGGKAVFPVAATDGIYGGIQVAVTSGKFINVTALGEDY